MFKRIAVLIILYALASTAGCKKPSYSDIKVDEHGGAAQENKQAPKAQTLDPESDLKQTGVMPAQGGAEKKGTPIPDFFDQAKARVKDIPVYPRSRATNIQFGPVGNTTMVMQVYKTRDKFETVTAFFDQALKNSGWTIAGNERGENLYTWELKKGASDQGAVQVEQQKEQNIVFIVLRRARSTVEAAQK